VRAMCVALAVGILTASIGTLAGAPFWIVLVLAALPWFFVLRERRGSLLAVGAVVLSSLWVVLVALIGSAAFRLPMLLTVVLCFDVLGIIGIYLLLRMGSIRGASGTGAAAFTPAFAGPLVWLSMGLVNAIASGKTRFSWVMSGDSPNNVLFARSLTSHSGIVIGGAQNPVPLPSALLALFMAPGRGSATPASLLEHDLLAFDQLWTLVIALLCFLTGVTAASIARRATAGSLITGVVAAACSLIPLSWLELVYPVEDGFFGIHVALVVLFAIVMLYQASDAQPRAVLGLLLVACTLLLAIWSPLVVIPVGLGAVVFVNDRRRFLASRGIQLGLLLGGVVQLVAYAVVVVIPVLASQGQLLTAGRATYVIPPVLVFSLILATVVVAILARRSIGARGVGGIAALATASLLGLGFLLFDSAKTDELWTYYPSKFAWTVCVVFVPVVIGTMTAALASLSARRWAGVASYIVAVGAAVGVIVTVPHLPGPRDIFPATSVFAGPTAATSSLITRSADLDHLTLHWQSGIESEQFVNFWVLEVASRSIDNVRLRTYAYGYNPKSISTLCSIVGLIHSPLTIVTAERSLSGQMRDVCPFSRARISVAG